MFLKCLFICLFVLDLHVGAATEIVDEVVRSQFLGANRNIQVYLPASYHQDTNRHYPVLYLHDGQNVFSTAGSNIAFGWGNWDLDRTAAELSRAKKMSEIIMVAVDNSAARYEEYCGRLSPSGTNQSGQTAYEKYAAFLVTELKPHIDREYRTKPGRADTAVMGSSMGGICSVVLAWEHPEIFGGAASLSGAFQVEHTNFLNHILKGYHDQPKPFRIYLDSGRIDFTGGDDGCALTGQVARELSRIGWGNSLLLYVDEHARTVAELEQAGLQPDKWPEAQTSQHNEFYWRLRAWRPLTFLFPSAEK